MAGKLTDEDAEKLVVSRGLLTPDRLTAFRTQAAVVPGTLFDVLVHAGIISSQLSAEVTHAASAAPPPRPVSASSGAFVRRPLRAHVFEEPHAPARPPSGVVPAVQAAPAPSSGSHTAVVHGVPAVPMAPPARSPPVTAHGLPPAIGEPSGPVRAADGVPALPRGWPGGIAPTDPSPSHVQQYLLRARQAGASDLYINASAVPALAVHGELRPLEGCPGLSAEQAAALVRETLTREQCDHLDSHGDLCFCYAFGGGRYRASIFKYRGGCGAAFRIIADHIPALDQLGLPAGCARLAQFADGLVLVAAPAGSGKTTTLMALADVINHERHAHILTLEEPVEYALPPANSRITQRDVGVHTASFTTGVHAALREDADVVVIGELRDDPAIAGALAAAEAGHLVLGTVQAPDCARAIDRILECADDAARRRNAVADNLRAIVSQQLIRRKDGQGRVAACEMLFNSISVGNIIREAKTQNLVNVMQTGRQQGMILLDDSLRALVEGGAIAGDEAYAHAKNKVPFKQYLPEAAKPAAEPAKALEPARAPRKG